MMEDSRNTRIMAKLKDSLLSHIAEFNPSLSINTEFIERRLQQLFNSFHTPTHPPYALMIYRAIMELNEATGSTEEAISELIRREYEDLPWAHVRILGLHLRKLCQDGELVCIEGGRYMLLVDDGGRMGDDGEETECNGSKKRKREKKRSNRGDGDGERKGTKESGEGIERDNELQEQGIEEQIQVSELHGAGTDEPSRLVEGQCEETEEQGEAHRQSIERIEEQVESEKGLLGVVEKQSQSQWRGTGVIEEHKEAEKDLGRMAQAQSEVEEPQIEDSISHLETICSSQPTALNPPVDSQQPLLVPISEGSPKCIPSAGIELLPMQLQLQMSCRGPSESGLGAAMSASLSSLDVHEHKQDENRMSGDPEQKPPKRPRRGRPPKLKTVADYPGESLFPSGDGILNKQKPNINKMEKQQQHGQGRGRGRPPKLNRNSNQCEKQLHPQEQAQQQGRGRGRGRPPKLNQNANQCEEHLQPQEQAQHHGQGRGRGRPPKLNQNANQCEEQLQPQEQAQHHGRGRGRGRPPKLNRNANQCKEQLQPQEQAQHRGRGRGRGRPPKLNRNTNQCEEQLQPQDQARGRGRGRPPKQKPSHQQNQGWDQNQGLGLERHPNPMSDASQSHQQLQPQPCKVQGSHQGRPLAS